jgi:flagellar hook-associated protein 3 FlgL
MRITSTAFESNFLNQINQLKTQQSTLQNEAATGLKVTLPEDNPAAMDQDLNLQNEESSNTQYQNNINALQGTATTASDALNSLQSLVEQASEIATSATGLSSQTQLTGAAAQVANLIQEALQVGNTKDDNGNYIFGGTNSNTPPFTATTDANGNVTGVTYNGNTTVDGGEIAPGLSVSAQIPGENNTGTGPSGLFADSRTGADLFGHLISLQQDLASGNVSAISSTDGPNLGNDEDNVVTQISGNGVIQSTLTAAGNVGTEQSTNIDSEMSNETNADMAQTLTQLTQTQTSYEAALESGTMVMNLSLVNFLS